MRYSRPRANEASTELAKSQELFDQQQYDKALVGFQKVAADYSSTDAGNLAQLYIGICQANLGKWQEAVNALEQFSGQGDQMISPAAEGALGNAYANLNQLDKAVEHLKKAAKMADNNSLSPTFLIQAGEILESQGKKDEALKLYEEVKEKYFNSMQYQSIDKYIERCKILENQGKKDEALKLYEEVKEKYFNSMQYQSIDKYIERCKM